MNPLSQISAIAQDTLGTPAFFETRLYYDESDRLEYVCKSPIVQESEDSSTWFITKLVYDGSTTNITQVIMPKPATGDTTRQGFIYKASERASYFP